MKLLKILRKPYFAILMTIIFMSPIFSSCSNELNNQIISMTSDEKLIDLSKHNLKKETFDKIMNKVIVTYQKKVINNNSNDNEKVISLDFLNRDEFVELEKEIQEILEPLVDNGREIRDELVSNLTGNDQDIEELSNLDDSQLVQLSMAMNTLSGKNDPSWTESQVVSCIGAALGINEAVELLSNTAQLATVEGTKKAVKLILKRYVGWIGLAVAIYSFADCMEAF